MTGYYFDIVLLAGAMVWLGACDVPQASGDSRALIVDAGTTARTNVPMSVELPEKTLKAALLDAATLKEVPCQVAEGRLWWILDQLAAGAKKTYTVQLGADSSADAAAVSLKQQDAKIDITIDGQPFTTYHFGTKLDWGRELWRPCFFPVFGPNQVQLMRPYPLVKDPPKGTTGDHPHHTGVWVAFGKVNGTDNWEIGPKKGRQLHKGFEMLGGGAVVGMFRENLTWTTADAKPVMAEVRTARVYRMPPNERLMDLEVTFQAKYAEVRFGDTKEGGICATRMRDELRADKSGLGGRLVNSGGLSGDAAWGKRADWVDCTGLVEGRRVGYAVFDNPLNLRHPTYWHARTYGLVTANPFGIAEFDRKSGQKGDYAIQADGEITFRFRLYFHAGDEKEALVAARYADYAEAPKAEWK